MRAFRLRRLAWLAASLLPLALATAGSADEAWVLPAPDACVPRGGLVSAPGARPDDAAVLPFKPGDVFSMDKLETLHRFIPDFLWTYRDRFFFDGMRLEIGPCFRDFSAPAFFQDATAKFAGQAKLTEDGGLEGYTAGLPFPPEALAAGDPKLGEKWLWNYELRYQAAGLRGNFRVSDLLGRAGRAEPFEGELFELRFAFRADRAKDGYTAPGAKDRIFVSGGLLSKPFDAREFAWRQFRDVAANTDARRSDELQAYLPNYRRVRRINSARVEGLYMPSFSVGVQQSTQITGAGAGGAGASGGGGATATIGGGGAEVGGTLQTKRSGFEGLVIRPLLHSAKVLGVQDVLTPINATTPMYPADADRDFGPWGLSFATDRWDLRRALVLELKTGGDTTQDSYPREILYVDLQTLQPLYVATFDDKDEMTNVGLYVGRWSEDRADYPRWPDDAERPIRVIDSVAESFANLAEAGSWRRESWDNVGTPPDDRTVKRMVSVNELTKRR